DIARDGQVLLVRKQAGNRALAVAVPERADMQAIRVEPAAAVAVGDVVGIVVLERDGLAHPKCSFASRRGATVSQASMSTSRSSSTVSSESLDCCTSTPL